MAEDYMKGSMRKLALWYTRTFKPIMTHDELEPIMATLGFVGLPPAPATPNSPALWKEYVYSAAGGWRSKWGSAASPANKPPLPRLPFPRIDGLHIYSYRAFVEAVNYYLEMCDISDLFHIRGMPLHDSNRMKDRNRKWRKMEEDDSVFVYREGTLDNAVCLFIEKEHWIMQQSTCTTLLRTLAILLIIAAVVASPAITMQLLFVRKQPAALFI